MMRIKWEDLSERERRDQISLALFNELTNAGYARDEGQSGAQDRFDKAQESLTSWESGAKSRGAHPDDIRKEEHAKEHGLSLIGASYGDDTGEQKDFVSELLEDD